MKNSWKRGTILAVAGAAAGIMALGRSAGAAVVNFGTSQDAEIFGTSAGADTGKASGMGPIIAAGADGSGNMKRSLIEFNVSSIPADATITGVTLTLYLAQVAGSGNTPLNAGGGTFPSNTIRLYDVLQPWTEGTSGSGTTAVSGSGMGFTRVTGDTSWDYASYNSADPTTGTWNNGTVNLHGGNFSATESADATFSSYPSFDPAFTWSSAGMIADVQGWVDDTATNDGWLMKSDSEGTPTSFLAFWSKEGAAPNDGTAPNLTIDYTLPAPEPTTLAVLGLAAPLLLFGRRRRTAR